MNTRLLPTKLLVSLALLFLSACSAPALSSGSLPANYQAGQGGVRLALVSIPPDATPTATPFQPLQPTVAYEPTRMVTSTPVATPTDAPIEYIGSYYQRPRDQVNILLLGSDQRIGDPSFRTDTIVLVTLNPSLGTASLTSFPRDLYIPIPGWINNRINTVFNLGGFQLLQQTFAYNFGVTPDHYVMVNFSAFTRTIDSLDGIDVNVAQQLTDHRDQKGKYTVKPGVNHMDGETALWYVRSRYTTSDFDRTRRQQEVVQALFDRLMSLEAVKRAPEIYDIYNDTVQTSLGLEDVTPLLPVAVRLASDSERVQNYYIGPQHVSRYIVPTSGADVLLPNQYAVLDLIYQAAGYP